MSTFITPLDSVSITTGSAGAATIPTGSLVGSGFDYTSEYAPALYINVYVTGSGNVYLQKNGSSNSADGRYVASGQTAQYGPVKYGSFPQIRFDAASGCWISFDVVSSEG